MWHTCKRDAYGVNVKRGSIARPKHTKEVSFQIIIKWDGKGRIGFNWLNTGTSGVLKAHNMAVTYFADTPTNW
jgi:hypothetical protein